MGWEIEALIYLFLDLRGAILKWEILKRCRHLEFIGRSCSIRKSIRGWVRLKYQSSKRNSTVTTNKTIMHWTPPRRRSRAPSIMNITKNSIIKPARCLPCSLARRSYQLHLKRLLCGESVRAPGEVEDMLAQFHLRFRFQVLLLCKV